MVTTLYNFMSLQRKMKILQAALERYADPDLWTADEDENISVFASGGKPGYEIARSALAQAGDENLSEEWRHNT